MPQEFGQGGLLSCRFRDDSPVARQNDERGGVLLELISELFRGDRASQGGDLLQDALRVEAARVECIEPDEECVISVDRADRWGCDHTVLCKGDAVHPANQHALPRGLVDGPQTLRCATSTSAVTIHTVRKTATLPRPRRSDKA